MWEPMARGARLAEQADRLRAGDQAGPLRPGLRRVRPPGVRRASSSSTPTRTSRPPGSRRWSPSTTRRTGKKEGLTETDVQSSKARAGRARHRALDRPLRRHDAVHRRPDARERAGLRLRGGDGGGDAARLQQAARRRSRGSSRSIRPRAPSTPTTRSSCSTRPGSAPQQRAGAQRFPGVPGRARSRPRWRRRSGFRPADLDDGAGGAGVEGERRRPGPARARARPARAARAGRDQESLARGPQARQRPARGRHLGLDERREPPRRAQSRASTSSSTRSSRRTASG